jgi:hypothetical protein
MHWPVNNHSANESTRIFSPIFFISNGENGADFQLKRQEKKYWVTFTCRSQTCHVLKLSLLIDQSGK